MNSLDEPNHPEDHQRVVRDLFHDCLSVAGDKRHQLIETRLAGKQELKEQVESMLAFHDQSAIEGDFLESPLLSLSGDGLGREWVGRSFDGFQVHSVLGIGGTSVVLDVTSDDQPEQEMALKLLWGDESPSDQIEVAQREQALLQQLDHPAIAGFVKAGQTKTGHAYILMEKVIGSPITVYCDDKTMRVDDRLKLFSKVCEAVEYAHQNLIVHRDLKPDNILVTAEGDIKLIDFGIAKPVSTTKSQNTTTHPSDRRLTLNYASPELIAGQKNTTSSDVYSLGVILYELLAGVRPRDWQGLSSKEIIDDLQRSNHLNASAQHAHWSSTDALEQAKARAVSPNQMRTRLSGDLDLIVAKALEVSAKRRYQSVEAFRMDLESFLLGLPVKARAPTFPYLMGRFVRRHKQAFAIGLVITMAMGASGFSVWRGSVAAENERKTTQAATEFLVRSMFEREIGSNETNKDLRREDIDRMRLAVETDLKQQNVLRSRILVTLGRLYHSLGDYDTSANLLHSVVSDPSLPLTFEARDRAHLYLAKSKYELGLYAEAIEVIEDVVQDKSRQLESGDLAEFKVMMAWCLKALGDCEEAELWARDALSTRQTLFGPEHELVAECWSNLGAILDDSAQYDEANKSLELAYEMSKKLASGQPSSQLSTIISHFVIVKLHLQQVDRAESLAQEAVAIDERLFPASHPRVLKSLSNLAGVQFQQRHFHEAAAVFARCVELKKTIYGEVHPEVVASLANLGATLNFAGEPGQAEIHLAEVVELQRKLLGPNHRSVAGSLRNLSMAHEFQGKTGSTELCLREALEIDEVALGRNHPNYIGDLHLLGNALMLQERFAEAVSTRVLAVELARKLVESSGPDAMNVNELRLAKWLSGLAEVHAENEAFEKAVSCASEAVDISRRYGLPDDDFRMARALASLSYAKVQLGDRSYIERLRTYHQALLMSRGSGYSITEIALDWLCRVSASP